VIKNNPC